VVYLDDERHLEIGVEVGPDVAPAADGEVTLSCTPSGLVASTSHVGPYAGLPDAREAIRQWCRAHRHRPSGASWEVYDHRGDVPSSPRTDVHHLLVPGARVAS
jgi:effector-binding domain-containing protein